MENGGDALAAFHAPKRHLEPHPPVGIVHWPMASGGGGIVGGGCRCIEPVTTPWWGYALLLVAFGSALALLAAMVHAQKRAFPRAVRLFVAPPMAYQASNVPRSLKAPTITLRQAATIASAPEEGPR